VWLNFDETEVSGSKGISNYVQLGEGVLGSSPSWGAKQVNHLHGFRVSGFFFCASFGPGSGQNHCFMGHDLLTIEHPPNTLQFMFIPPLFFNLCPAILGAKTVTFWYKPCNSLFIMLIFATNYIYRGTIFGHYNV
jgi:hypothetical protein